MDISLELPHPSFVKADFDTTHATFRLAQDATPDRHHLAVAGHSVTPATVETDHAELLQALQRTLRPHDPELADLLEPVMQVLRKRNDRNRHQLQDELGLYMTAKRCKLDPAAWSEVPTARRALENFTATARDIVLFLASEHAGKPLHGATIAEALSLHDGTRAVAASVRQGFSQVCEALGEPVPVHTFDVDGDPHYVVVAEWATTFRNAEQGLVRPLSPSDPDWSLVVLPELLNVLAEHYGYDYPFVGFQALGDQLKDRIPGLKLNWRRDLPTALVDLQRLLWDIDPTLPWITGLVQTGRQKLSAPVRDLAAELGPDLGGQHAVVGNAGITRFTDTDSLDDLTTRLQAALEVQP